MTRITRRSTLAASLAAVIVGLGTTAAIAAGDTDDNISPASTAYTATNSGNITFTGTVSGINDTFTCTSASISATTPATGLGPVNTTSPPTFSGCTDTIFGNDTVTTSGTSQVTFVDNPNEAAEPPDTTEPNTGDSISVTIPKAGIVIKAGPCTITLAPAGPVTITATYDDRNGLRFTNASIPVKGNLFCSVGLFKINVAFKTTVNIRDGS